MVPSRPVAVKPPTLRRRTKRNNSPFSAVLEVTPFLGDKRDQRGKRIGYSNRVKPHALLSRPFPASTLPHATRSFEVTGLPGLHSASFGLTGAGDGGGSPQQGHPVTRGLQPFCLPSVPPDNSCCLPESQANRPGSYGFPSRTMATKSRRSLRQEPTSTCGFALRAVRRSWNSRRGAPFFESRHAARNRYRRSSGRPRLVMRVLPRNIPEEIV